jgi:hypothetical protein
MTENVDYETFNFFYQTALFFLLKQESKKKNLDSMKNILTDQMEIRTTVQNLCRIFQQLFI